MDFIILIMDFITKKFNKKPCVQLS